MTLTNELVANLFMEALVHGKRPYPAETWIRIDLPNSEAAVMLHDGTNSGLVIGLDSDNPYPVSMIYLELRQGHAPDELRSEGCIRVWTPENIIGLERPMDFASHRLGSEVGDEWDAYITRSSISSADLSWLANAPILLTSLSNNLSGERVWHGPGRYVVSDGADEITQVLFAVQKFEESNRSAEKSEAKVAENKRGFFSKIFSGKKEATPEVDLGEYERFGAKATRGYNNIFSMRIEDVVEEGYAQIKNANYEAGKMAHGSRAIPESLATYYPIHFLVHTAWLVSYFESDFKSGIAHLTGAAEAFENLESQIGFPNAEISESLERVGAEYRNKLKSLMDAAVEIADIDENHPLRRSLINQAIEIHSPSRYPLDQIWSAAIIMARSLIDMAREPEDFQSALAPIGTAMNFLTASMEMGSRPYHAIREVTEAGELFDYSLIALCGSGHIEKAVEIYEQADFSEIDKPWRESGGAYSIFLDLHAEVLASCPKFLFEDS